MMTSHVMKSLIFDRYRSAFSLLYPFLKQKPSVIGTPFYVAKLMNEISAVVQKKLAYFHRHKKLPPKYGIGLSERCVEIPWFFSQLDRKEGLHLDAGSSLNFDAILRLDPLKRKKIIIANLNPEMNCYWHAAISYVFWDLRKPLFDAGVFDSISCISVLEHIGLDNSGWTHHKEDHENNMQDYRKVVKEFRRILKPGGSCYITVPYGVRKQYGWLQVFDKSMIRRIIDTFEPRISSTTYFQYTKSGWIYSDENTSKYSDYSTSYLPDYIVGAKSAACVRLIK